MAWVPPAGIELDEAYYDIMPKITHSNWNRFARSALRLDQNDIEEIRAEHSGNVKEMKYQMFLKWQQNTGAAANVDTIYAVLNHFIGKGPRPDLRPAVNKTQMNTPQNLHRPDAVPIVDDTLPPADYCKSVQRVVVQRSDPGFYNTVKNQTGSIYPRKGKGRTFILNNMFHHHGTERRKGSEIDLENMRKLWEKLGSEVIVHTDLAANDLTRELRAFSDKCDGSDYCVIFIMSHGNCKDGREIVYGNDRGEVNVKEIEEIFDNIQATHLQEIPKLFFFQCCRGNSPDVGVPLDQGGDAATPIKKATGPVKETMSDATFAKEANTVADAAPNLAMLPRLSDVLIAHATQSGFQAFRNTTEGSWFVNAIANVFMRHAKDEHVADLMTKVHNAVSTQSTDTSDRSMAMPEAKSTLRRKLYLFPGIFQ